MTMLLEVLLIFTVRVINISLGTLRTTLGMRGQRGLATAIGFFEALTFILSIGLVLEDLGNVWKVLSYCGGFAAGTYVGLAAEEKLALGYAAVRAISQGKGEAIALVLRQAGFGVTEMAGEGMAGQVQLLTAIARRRDIPAIMALVCKADEKAFITVDDASQVHRGHL